MLISRQWRTLAFACKKYSESFNCGSLKRVFTEVCINGLITHLLKHTHIPASCGKWEPDERRLPVSKQDEQRQLVEGDVHCRGTHHIKDVFIIYMLILFFLGVMYLTPLSPQVRQGINLMGSFYVSVMSVSFPWETLKQIWNMGSNNITENVRLLSILLS